MATQDRLPTSDTYAGWTASIGTDRWAMVDDPIGTPDEDATYCYRQNSGNWLMFGFTPFAIAASSITKVSVTMRGRAEAATDTVFNRARIIVGGVGYTGAASPALTTAYADYVTDWLTNPATGLAWTKADVEGTGPNPLQEFGLNPTGISAGEGIRCTQCYCTVTYTAAGGGALLKIIAETAQVSDGYIRHMSMTRPVSESESISEGVLRLGVLRRILAETASLTESLLRRGALKRLLGESTSISEFIMRRTSLTRLINETQNLSETLVRSISALFTKVVNEGLQITAAISRRLGLSRYAIETVSVSESVTRRGTLRRIVVETASIAEGMLKNMSLMRVASETLRLVEDVLRRGTFIRVVSEALDIAEGALKYLGMVKVLSEGLSIIEGILKKIGLDTLGVLGENLTLIFGSVRRGIRSMTARRDILSKTPKREVKP